MSGKKGKKNRDKTRHRKSVAKVFVLTLIICTAVFTTGMTVFSKLLDSQVMAKSETSKEPKVLTAEEINVMIEGEGIFAKDYSNSKRVNILLLGTTDEELADTIMLASFDPDEQRVDVISVPRDTYYEREGYASSYLKLNAVNHDGSAAMAQAVHEILLGIPINYYAVIDYAGVIKIIDSMDGVPMDVPMDMFYNVPEQNLYINLYAGEQILNGDQSVQLLRFREGYNNGDIGRVETQQQFMKNAIKRAMGFNLPKVAKKVIDNVDSNVTLNAMLYVAQKAKGLDMNNVTTQILPGSAGKIKGETLSYFIRGTDMQIEEMLRTIYNPLPPQAETTEGEDTEGEDTATN